MENDKIEGIIHNSETPELTVTKCGIGVKVGDVTQLKPTVPVRASRQTGEMSLSRGFRFFFQ